MTAERHSSSPNFVHTSTSKLASGHCLPSAGTSANNPNMWTASSWLIEVERVMKNTGVGRFRRWLCAQRASFVSTEALRADNPFTSCASDRLGHSGTLHRKLLPMHLPLAPPELVGAKSETHGPKALYRLHTRKVAWKWVEWLISFWSYVCLGSLRSSKEYQVLGEYDVSGEQMILIVPLFHEVLRYVRLRPDVPSGPGRGTHTMLELLKTCESSIIGSNLNESHWEKLAQTVADSCVVVLD